MLRDFLLDIAVDPRKLVRFADNPSKLLKHGHLSVTERKALRAGDLEKLRSLLAQSAGQYDVYMSNNQTTSPPVNQTQNPPFPKSFWKVMRPSRSMSYDGLTIVGTGIRAGLQTTPEAQICIEQANEVLYLVADAVNAAWILKLNPAAESLEGYYKKGKPRLKIYEAIVKKILSRLRACDDLCVVFYGHPGVFVHPAREAIRRARAAGFNARMLPAISADANLFADLGVDPGVVGMQSYEATSFLINDYQFDTSAGLLLWQIGVLGEVRWMPGKEVKPKTVKLLADRLSKRYGRNHKVVLYQAAEVPIARPSMKEVSLAKLPHTKISGVATLYVPPKRLPVPNVSLVKTMGIRF